MSKPQVSVSTTTSVHVENEVKVTAPGGGDNGCARTLTIAVLAGVALFAIAGGNQPVTQNVNVSVSAITCPPTCGLYATEQPPATVNVVPQTVEEIEASRDALVTVIVLVVLCVVIAVLGSIPLRNAAIRRERDRRDWEIIDGGGR